MARTLFPHERLDAWHLACRAYKLALEYTATLPAGLHREVQQINSAAGSVVRNTCEGAGRWRPAEKVHKFEIAVAEGCEAGGAVQAQLAVGNGDSELGEAFLQLESRAARP